MFIRVRTLCLLGQTGRVRTVAYDYERDGKRDGALTCGRLDQQWTLARVKTVIGGRFHLTYTIQGVRKLLVRNGWSCQIPARRAVERDDDAVAG
ncbi:winged helix-turn-helix domain-containing protein [Streptomyces sp. NBC_00882]|uniref:helix-turn-helix domain-containing protein n=1 Tax=Streptomyces TaxID=1883 RepID=UPI00386AFCED|nr:winged helix-turn-helix domain-containing protein [Streptomyces sp. NBC_00882]WSZ58482.1 winged helix-turn-helix domain-containing protein [Streptomyces canus]